MSAHDITVACDVVSKVGEGPLWAPEEKALYWVDIDGKAVQRLCAASGKYEQWAMPAEPSALARDAQGGLVVAMRSGFFHLNTDNGALTQLTPAPFDQSVARFNDGKVDPAGRFWVGTIYEPRDKEAAEMFVLERGEVRKAWSGGMTNSNGLGFSPDGKTMYHADTATHRVRCFDFDVKNGAVSNERELRRFDDNKSSPSYGGRPDGAAVDSEGNYWVAMFEGGRIVKLSPSGELLDEIKLPVRCPTMVAFGGADLRTLYITSASKRPAEELAAMPLSGKLLSLRVSVAGRIEPAYVA